MSGATAIEHVLRHERRVALAGLVLLCTLAWGYVLSGAGLGMRLADMTTTALFPHRAGGAGSTAEMAVEPWAPGVVALVALMWWVMMIAMMTPSAAPMILLHARVARHAEARGKAPRDTLSRTGVFVLGYLLAWLGFSLAATALQGALRGAGLIEAMSMWSASGVLSATVLVTAGVYQWTPLKSACLEHCRAPAEFLAAQWRPGASGALRLGIVHGTYCVGCCWALMALLFVGGVMNPLWIVALTLIVLVEKVTRAGPVVSRAAGALLIAWGITTLFV